MILNELTLLSIENIIIDESYNNINRDVVSNKLVFKNATLIPTEVDLNFSHFRSNMAVDLIVNLKDIFYETDKGLVAISNRNEEVCFYINVQHEQDKNGVYKLIDAESCNETHLKEFGVEHNDPCTELFLKYDNFIDFSCQNVFYIIKAEGKGLTKDTVIKELVDYADKSIKSQI